MAMTARVLSCAACRRALSYAEVLAQRCAACEPDAFRALARSPGATISLDDVSAPGPRHEDLAEAERQSELRRLQRADAGRLL